jgi:TonB family protein
MKYFMLFLFLSLLAGCSSAPTYDLPYTLPHLLEQSPLPALPPSVYRTNMELILHMLILENGSVGMVKFLNTSGNESWDSLAAESIRKWRFAPATVNDKPIRLWIRQRACVQCVEPLLLPLSEILLKSREEADSVYQALKRGEDFGLLAAKYSVAVSRERQGALGEVDIHRYTENIKKILQNLPAGEFTEPITYGQNTIIFKRMKWEVRLEKE